MEGRALTDEERSEIRINARGGGERVVINHDWSQEAVDEAMRIANEAAAQRAARQKLH